mgnify:CR=1 FL=1
MSKDDYLKYLGVVLATSILLIGFIAISFLLTLEKMELKKME